MQTQYIRVESLKSPRTGNAVANQFAIHTNDGTYFQSYNTIIAYWPHGESKIVLDTNSWDYSRTTLKYLKQFLRVNSSKKDIEKSIRLGDFVLQDLN
jgi:hypothetical protein